MTKLKFYTVLILFISASSITADKKSEANAVLCLKIQNNTNEAISVISTPNGH